MKKIILLLMLFISVNSFATTYYVKVAGQNNSTGLSDAAAWSPDKFISSTFLPGDIIMFKRGDVFNFVLSAQSSGTASQPIVYGAYGFGANPKFTQFQTLTNWTLSSGSIYSCDFDVFFLTLIVTFDNHVQPRGRFPRTSYKYYTNVADGGNGSTILIGSDIGALPFNPAGGQAVIRKNRYNIDVNDIVSVNGDSLKFQGSLAYGNSYNNGTGGTGFFIQNHIATLTQKGDWFYDKVAKKLFMHFGNDQPSSHVVKAGTGLDNAVIESKNYLIFNDLDFEGANIRGVQVSGCDNIRLNNCKSYQQGGEGFSLNGSNISLINCETTDCLNNSIGSYETTNLLIDGAKVKNSGTVNGAAKSSDHQGNGITVLYGNVIIRNSSIIKSGGDAVNVVANQFLIENNFADTSNLLKDDGGLCYVYNPDKSSTLPKILRKNIGLNAIGTFEGAKTYGFNFGMAVGIYLDAYSTNITVDSNFVANGGWTGILNNGGKNNSFTNNTCYNFGIAQFIHNKDNVGSTDVSNNIVTGNTFIAKNADQSCMYFYTNGVENPKIFGTYDNNVYAQLAGESKTISINGNVNRTLTSWKVYSGQDAASIKSPVTSSDPSTLVLDYNFTDKAVTVNHAGLFRDMTGKLIENTLLVPAYGGSFLVPYKPKFLKTPDHKLLKFPGGKFLVN